MDRSGTPLHRVAPAPEPSSLASRAMPRRSRYRVQTAALDIPIVIRMGDHTADGHLLDISAGGCLARVGLPLTLMIDPLMPFDVTLPKDGGHVTCDSELVGLHVGKGSISLRVRFGALDPATRRDLLEWIGALLLRDFQVRHTGGNRTWRPRRPDSEI